MNNKQNQRQDGNQAQNQNQRQDGSQSQTQRTEGRGQQERQEGRSNQEQRQGDSQSRRCSRGMVRPGRQVLPGLFFGRSRGPPYGVQRLTRFRPHAVAHGCGMLQRKRTIATAALR